MGAAEPRPTGCITLTHPEDELFESCPVCMFHAATVPSLLALG